MRIPGSGLSLVVAAVTVSTTTACKARDRAAERADTAAVVAPADTVARANVPHDGWTDAQILAYTAAANNGEIAEGKLAQTKARNAQVKAFARQMVADHQAMLREGRQFASSHNITPDTTKDDVTDFAKDAREELKDLTEKKAGADWDKDYLDKQIDDHKEVLDKLQDVAKNTNNEALRQMLAKASGKVQEHLTKAQALKEKYPAS